MLYVVTHGNETAKPRVLIVDDDEDVREVLSLLLDDEGFDVVTAKNGADALAHLEDGNKPDVILLDLMMPVMSGWEFWDHVQESLAYHQIPIIVLTASGLTQGCIGHARVLPKPVGPKELLAALAEARGVQPAV